MITIRDRDMKTVAQGPAQGVLPERSSRVPLERIDLYATTSDGPAMLGVCWTDGSSGVCDWLTGRACRDWLAAQPWAQGKIRVHFKNGPQADMRGLEPLLGTQS